MNPAQSLAPAAQSPVSAAEQARTIRKAQGAGRAILAWTATLADGRTVVLLAATERGARSLVPIAQRVAPAAVRDVDALVTRALAAAPAPAPRAVAAPRRAAFFSADEAREWARLLREEERELSEARAASDARAYWLTGEGTRPALPEPSEAPRVAGQPRHEITARPRPGVGAPFVGEASMVGTGRGVRAAHEYVPARPATLAWNPAASPATLRA